MKWILLLFLLMVSLVHAEGPDQEYIRIYSLISQADTASTRGDVHTAQTQYREAQTALRKLQSIYPQWNEGVVKYRLGYLAEKVQSNLSSPVANEVAHTSNVGAPSEAKHDDLRRLKSENKLLEAKLKEALSVQPNIFNSIELAKTEEKLVALEKERDLLKVALEQGEAATQPSVVAQKKSPVGDDKKEIEKLRARLEALEARPIPYTPEELALFKQPFPQLAAVEAKPVKKSKELPAGSGALVAQAERAFAARRFDEAEKKYQEVLRQDEENVYILGNLGATQLEMNNVAAAEKTVQRALLVDPDDSFALTLLGMIKFRQDQFDTALDALSRSAQINPENPETQNYLGITLSQKGQRAAAEAALRKAIKTQPNYAGAHHNLAVIYATQKPPFVELARWHYEKSRALGHPKNSDLEKLIGEK